jgi:hypothetical protein
MKWRLFGAISSLFFVFSSPASTATPPQLGPGLEGRELIID